MKMIRRVIYGSGSICYEHRHPTPPSHPLRRLECEALNGTHQEVVAEMVGTSHDTTLTGTELEDVAMANGGNGTLSGSAGTDPARDNYIRLIIMIRGDYHVTGATKIDALAAKAMIDRGGAAFVDVRSPLEFARGHIPGAHNIGQVGDLSKEGISEIAGKNDGIVFYCHGKRCPHSAFASAKALAWDLKNIYYFAGGYPAWVDAGYPVEGAK